MNRDLLAQELDHKIDALLMANAPAGLGDRDPLLQIAAELRLLPSDQFKSTLGEQLTEQAAATEFASLGIPQHSDTIPFGDPQFAPSFSTRQFAALPADPRSLLLSFLSHAAVVALIASGIWVGTGNLIEKHSPLGEVSHLILPPGDGGGGGGNHNPTEASRGTPPRFSDTQFAPPAIVVTNENPKLQADATVLGPPEPKLPQSKQIGDLFSSNTVIPSNGSGGPSGIGDNSGTGDGRGNDGGVGIGSKAGFGGTVFRPGNGVSAPHVIYNPDPEYSEEARRVKYQGNVVLSLIVDVTGHVRDIRVARSVGLGLDEKAKEAVAKWRFAPGMKDGHPVATQVNVEVAFRLY